jgi:hypothetical protein
MNVETTLTRPERLAPEHDDRQQAAADERTEERRTSWWWLVARFLGALAVLAVGVIHLQQYFGPYSTIPNIGTLFLVNFGAATIIGLALLAPTERLTGRTAGAAIVVVTLAGIALSAGSFVLLAISEQRPLFGFMEPGYDPAAIAASRAAEVAAVVLLVASLVARFVPSGPKTRW